MARLVQARFAEEEIIKFFNLAVRMQALEKEGDPTGGTGMPGVNAAAAAASAASTPFQTPGYRLGYQFLSVC